MRLIAALLLLLPLHSWGVSMSQCPDGQFWYVTANGSSTCPSNITVTNTSPGATTATITGTATASAGTAAVSIRTTCTPVQWRVAALGTGDEASDTSALSSGAFTLDITGLAESTTYCAHVLVYDDDGDRPTKTTYVTFTTLDSTPPATGTEITGGDDWFYCPDGNDANSGLTHALRKKTLPATDTLTLGASDDMWLCTGGVWNTTSIDIARAGTSGDYSEMGCYYMDGSTPRKCLDGVMGLGTTHTKPVFMGGITDACLDAGTCTYPLTGFPREGYASKFDGIYSMASTADYHHVQNISFVNGRYGTIVATGGGTTGALHHLIFDGVDLIQNGWQSMITMIDGVGDAVVRNSTSYRSNQCEVIKLRRTSSDTSACDNIGWPGTTVINTRKGQRTLYEYNVSIQGFGEGIDICYNNGAGYFIVRNNIIVNSFSDGIYIDGCEDAVIEGNIVLGGNAQHNGWTNTSPAFTGVHIGVEEPTYNDATGMVIRNNLLVGASGCIEGNMFVGSASGGRVLGGKVYGNTCIGARSREMFLDEVSANVSEWVVTNNAVWNETLSASAICQMTSAATGGYNRYTTAPSDGDCTETGNTSGAMGLTQSTYSWWTSIANVSGAGGNPTLPTFADANPAGGSALIGSGTALTSAILDIANYGFAFDQIREVLDTTLTEAEWECALCVDATGATRASPPSIGAVE